MEVEKEEMGSALTSQNGLSALATSVFFGRRHFRIEVNGKSRTVFIATHSVCRGANVRLSINLYVGLQNPGSLPGLSGRSFSSLPRHAFRSAALLPHETYSQGLPQRQYSRSCPRETAAVTSV